VRFIMLARALARDLRKDAERRGALASPGVRYTGCVELERRVARIFGRVASRRVASRRYELNLTRR